MRMITGILAATILLVTAWTAAAQAQTPDQIVLTSPDIQTGAPVTLLAFSGTAARRGEPDFDGARLCGLNKIVKQIDLTSPQFFAELFNKVQISAASIASSVQGTVFYQVDLTGVAVDEIIRSDSVAREATPGNNLTETVILHATTVKYTYQPVNALGQKNGPPVTFGWNCIANTALPGSSP